MRRAFRTPPPDAHRRDPARLQLADADCRPTVGNAHAVPAVFARADREDPDEHRRAIVDAAANGAASADGATRANRAGNAHGSARPLAEPVTFADADRIPDRSGDRLANPALIVCESSSLGRKRLAST